MFMKYESLFARGKRKYTQRSAAHLMTQTYSRGTECLCGKNAMAGNWECGGIFPKCSAANTLARQLLTIPQTQITDYRANDLSHNRRVVESSRRGNFCLLLFSISLFSLYLSTNSRSGCFHFAALARFARAQRSRCDVRVLINEQ